MTKEQLAEAVRAIKIEPPIQSSSTAAKADVLSPKASGIAVTPKDTNRIPELLELLDAENLAQALTNLNAAEKKIEQIKKNNDERLKVTLKGFANVLSSSIIAKKLEELKVITPADIKVLTQSEVDGIYELKKQLVESQLLLKKHANPLVKQLIAIVKANNADVDPQQIIKMIPTEIPQAPSIESMSKQQLLEAIRAIKLEPYKQEKTRVSPDLSGI